MKTEKIATLTLEIGKQMFFSGVESLKQFALHHYTEEELTKKEFPKSCDDVYKFYDKQASSLASSSIRALATLLIYRDEWWEIDGNWKPDWTSSHLSKYCIYNRSEKLGKETLVETHCIFCFRTPEIRDEFLETFRESLEICKFLI